VKAIAQKLADTHAALNALSPDLKAANEPRVTGFENQWQQYLAEAAADVNKTFEQSVVVAEKQAAQLDYRSPGETATHLNELSVTVHKINDYEADFTNYVALRSDLIQRASAAQARFDAYDRELKKLNNGMASLKTAHNFADFSAAISSMASSEFSSAPNAMAAQTVQSLGANDQVVLRSLLNATNAATWAFLKKGKPPTLMPELAMPVERTLFQQLNADPALNADHQRYRFWLESNKSKPIEWVTAGALDSSLGWKKILAWTVEANSTNAVFTDHDYGYFNGQWKFSAREPIDHFEQLPTPTEAAPFKAAELDKVWLGSNTYGRPLLQALDAVKDSADGSPICRAYLLCQFAKIMEFQPDDWGLAFCPSARTDVERIRKIVGGDITSGDWFVPVKVNAWSDKLEQVFASAKTSSYLKQATGNLLLAQSAARDGLQFVGFADMDGKPVFTSAQSPKEVYGYDPVTKKPTLLTGSALPLSPLFALPLSRAEYLAKAGVDPRSSTFNNALIPLFWAKN
jgi:hypothetical protein